MLTIYLNLSRQCLSLIIDLQVTAKTLNISHYICTVSIYSVIADHTALLASTSANTTNTTFEIYIMVHMDLIIKLQCSSRLIDLWALLSMALNSTAHTLYTLCIDNDICKMHIFPLSGHLQRIIFTRCHWDSICFGHRTHCELNTTVTQNWTGRWIDSEKYRYMLVRCVFIWPWPWGLLCVCVKYARKCQLRTAKAAKCVSNAIRALLLFWMRPIWTRFPCELQHGMHTLWGSS